MHHVVRSLVPPAARHLLQRTPKRVVIIGAGPTGLFCADRLRHHFEVTVVDAKEYFEFTPGILRALVDPAHLPRITFDYREVLERQLGVEFVLGKASSIGASPGNVGTGNICIEPVEGTIGNPPGRINFNYCVVAVGVSNGIWKPRFPGQPPWPPWAARPMSSGGSGPSSSIEGGAGTDVEEGKLEARRSGLRALRERITTSRGVVVVGAGLVGVELAAEIKHFFPRVKVTLVDGAQNVLPQVADGARDYARTWLQQHGVKLRLSTPFRPELVGEGQVVLWCAGTASRASSLFEDASVLRPNGQIRVNRRMQVLRRVPSAEEGAESSSAGKPVELEPLAQGRILAVGDAAAVEGVPTAQMIFHGEEMAAIAVANIEAAEDIASPLAWGSKSRREAEPGLPLLCCTSLGPLDGMFSTHSELVLTGPLAAMQKQLIEETKMSALRGDLLGNLLWMPLH